ncbi:hypothetical protein BZZ01_31030 [Nostocales cyanobacterium HT-58-2]|nr:hypothetical protein BZZ01_31030 [Nostocales cyanobacterium HT-58-2]
MTAICHHFETLASQSQCTLIPFLTAGDLNLETTVEALQILDRNGADMIELGVPYSVRSTNPILHWVSVMGVTGIRWHEVPTRRQLPGEARVLDLLNRIRGITDKPVCVGFGISQSEQARQV